MRLKALLKKNLVNRPLVKIVLSNKYCVVYSDLYGGPESSTHCNLSDEQGRDTLVAAMVCDS